MFVSCPLCNASLNSYHTFYNGKLCDCLYCPVYLRHFSKHQFRCVILDQFIPIYSFPINENTVINSGFLENKTVIKEFNVIQMQFDCFFKIPSSLEDAHKLYERLKKLKYYV